MSLGRGCLLLTIVGCALFSAGLSGCAVPARSNTETKDIATASDETSAEKRAHVRMELASAYFARGQLTTALDEVKQALAANPDMGEAYNLRGLIYAGLGDDALASESFKRALQINPNDGDTLHNYGWYLCQLKSYPEAQALFKQALALPNYPTTARTLLISGGCQARAGDWAAAEATLSKAYQIDPSNPATAVTLSEVLLHRGELERARFYVHRVNAVAEQSTAQTLWLAARIEVRLGNRQAANEYGLQLRDRFPRSRESAAFDQGKFDE